MHRRPKPTVLILGGGGEMGRAASRYLAQSERFSRVIVAGIDHVPVRDFTATLGDAVSFRPVDIRDAVALSCLVETTDIVLNMAGPFYRLGSHVADAVIAAGKPCIDICDDIAPTLALLDRDAEARAAGSCLLAGMGLSPGVSNLLAVMAVQGLDKVEALDTVWDLAATVTVDDGYGVGSDGSVPGALVHWMHVCSGKFDSLESGRWVATRPVEPTKLSLTDGDVLPAWSVAHPETLTLPRRFPGLVRSRNFMAGGEQVMRLLQTYRDAIDSGRLSVEEAAADLVAKGIGRLISLDREETLRGQHRDAGKAYVYAIAEGRKGGIPTRSVARQFSLPKGGMATGTGLPAAIAAEMWADGLLPGAGVFTPEIAIDPTEFFSRFSALCERTGSDPVTRHDIELLQ